MINKIVGYSGFRTYGELEYPTQKQGKELQLTNQIWSSTVRDVDKIKPLQNFHNHKTIYKRDYLQNTFPEHYHPEHVPKGGHTSLSYAKNSSSKPYDAGEGEKYGNGGTTKNGYNLLKTGTEHWKSNYQASIGQAALLNRTQNLAGTGSGNLVNQSKLRPSTGNAGNGNDGANNAGNTNNGNTGFGGAALRSQSAGKSFGKLGTQEESKAQSYKNRAYINNCKTGITDYKFNYGDKIGHTPLDILNQTSFKQPLRNNPLKHGTNQLWTQIPGYAGFKPAEMNFKELEHKINQRSEINKGNLKLNLVENYHVNVPGYAGFKSKYKINENQLRQSCFSYKKE